MWLRRAFFRWLFPAAAVLPLWLLIGWGVFQADGWAFLWVLFIAVPSVLIGQLVLTLLVRARPSVRTMRAVSWWDAVGFTLWHALIVAVGCFPEAWFGWALAGAIVVALALFWSSLAQLWQEARGAGRLVMEEAAWVSTQSTPPASPGRAPSGEIFIISEVKPSDD